MECSDCGCEMEQEYYDGSDPETADLDYYWRCPCCDAPEDEE